MLVKMMEVLVKIAVMMTVPGNGARNPSCYLLSTALVFP